MKRFNVLDQHLDLSHHYLIEASAGTGKTFSIENIILRLLIEGDDAVELNQILAVTFTRAAVADMKQRVRDNLKNALDICKKHLQGNDINEAPDFLKCLLTKNEQSAQKAKRNLEQALAAYDQVNIYTIHAYCARMLREQMIEGGYLTGPKDGENDLSPVRLEQIVKDFFRTELTPDLIDPLQLKILIHAYKDLNKLIKALRESIVSIMPIESVMTYQESFKRFKLAIVELKQKVCGSKLLEDFLRLAPYYKGVCNKQKQILPEIAKAAEVFTRIFDKIDVEESDFQFLITQKGFWTRILKDKYKNFPILNLHYPQFADMYGELERIIYEASNPVHIYSIMASRCQKFGQEILLASDQLGFNRLLSVIHQACQNSVFVKNIRSRFKAVIIDEFQDTDPLQWDIFKLLFPPEDNSWGRLFLVGDPKQSIYSFRQADIYTYLSAGNSLSNNCKANLDCNFRSEPSLIQALNALFDVRLVPHFIQLPRKNLTLDCLSVSSGGKVQDAAFNDHVGSVHFMTLSDQKYSFENFNAELFPYIASEMQRLHLQNGVKLSQFAVLVADRFQANSFISYLRRWNMHAEFQRASSLSKSNTVKAVRELLTAVVNPKDVSSFKIALGGPLIGWSHLKMGTLENEEIYRSTLNSFFYWQQILWQEDFASFYRFFCETKMDGEEATIEERLLSREDSLSFYHEFQQLANWLIERQKEGSQTPEDLIDDLIALEGSEDEQFDQKVQTLADESAIKVLTIHSSKGLEFDFVFAIGLVKRSQKPSTLVPIPDEIRGYYLKPVKESSIEYRNYCEEVDAEKMRQLYVAMTRAKHRLYIPVVSSGKAEYGTASPMELFLARWHLIEIENHYENLYEKVALNHLEDFKNQLKPLMKLGCITSSLPQVSFPLKVLEETFPEKLFFPQRFEIPGKQGYLKSYTQLSQPKSHGLNYLAAPPPNDMKCLLKSPHTLPAGSEVGILLHSLLENISFKLVREAKSPSCLLGYVAGFLDNSLFKDWECIFCEMIYRSLTTPLFDGVPPLVMINDFECYREMEFVYPSTSEYEFDGYLKGVIDLIFRYGSKYYIIDWKSNWLGPNLEDYGHSAMCEAMGANDYFLQARIYKEALKRYLRLVNDAEFDLAYGGTAYIFLRGISNETGVFHVEDL